MTDYVFLHNADGEIEGCDACRVEVPTAEFARTDDGVKRLCEVCATSDTGNIIERPGANDPLLRTTAVAANRVLIAMDYFMSAETVDAMLIDKERIRPGGREEPEPPYDALTEAEKKLYDAYTTQDRSHRVMLLVGDLYLQVNSDAETVRQAEFVRAELAKMLAVIVKEQASVPTRG